MKGNNWTYEGKALIADPVHQYIVYTTKTPEIQDETTEKDFIDSPWVQRLRSIFQLQSARWVYPAAEHTRFQHVLGVMHIAGKMARHLYPSLKSVAKDCPSPNYIEGFLRVAGILHDIGHGPFGHFFDHNYLNAFDLTHEIIGQEIIIREFGDMITGVRRSPNGFFEEGERIEPSHIAFIIGRSEKGEAEYPLWLTMLKPIFSGIYTADNLDYVLRDSYMCGVAVGPVDIERLIYYSFFTEKGLTLHRFGSSTLTMFLNARLYLYTNVYYHRTTRAIDLHLKDLFSETIKLIFPANPLEDLEGYLNLTDWSLFEQVKGWIHDENEQKRNLGKEWRDILNRKVKWKMAYEDTQSLTEIQRGLRQLKEEELENEIKRQLPPGIDKIEFRVDMASQDPRPLNPLSMGDRQIFIYDPSSETVSKEQLRDIFRFIPARVVQCRIFTQNHDYDKEIFAVAEKIFKTEEPSINTNV